MGMRRMLFVMWKEVLELRQDPRIFGIIFIAPIVQLTILGYAATTDVRNVPVVVVDADRSSASQELISRFSASGIFSLVDVVSSAREIDRYLERGEAWMALSIPANYGARVDAGRSATLQVIADGSDASSTNIAMGYATNLIAGYAADLAQARTNGRPRGGTALAGPAGAAAERPAAAVAGGIDTRVRVWFNPTIESRYFMLPGIFALLLLVVTSNLSSMAIVREREIGTLEQLNVTPLGRAELIFGKLLPYGIIGLIDAFIVLLVIVFWFEVPLRGSFWLLVAMSFVYLLTTLGLGLFVSTISHTQQQAMMTLTFFFMMPMMFLSGFVFPIENMPTWIQPVTFLIPLRYFVVILRGIFLKGVGLETLWPHALALFVWGATILTLAVLRSSKRLA
jgi:ABC-2 type transport system permease protein